MKTNLKTIVPAVLMMTVLSACGSFGKKDRPAEQPAAQTQPAAQGVEIRQPQTVQVDSIDGTKEVAYRCGNQPVNVMYGFKGNEVVAAQVKINDQLTPGLFRVIGNKDQNMFTGNGITWVADKATAKNVDKVNGNMLTQEAIQTVNGQPQQVSQILVKGCVLAKPAKSGKAKAKK